MSFKYAKGKALSGLFTCGYAIGGRLVNCKTREVVAAVRAGIIEDAKTVVSALFAASLGDA